jgi:putative two-component system response regulator
MLRAWLEMGGGFRVLEAATGVEALDIVAESPPDVISTEMWLAGLDGYELCRRLRANLETRLTPIIALTSRGMPHDVERAFQAGCNAVLVKPSVPAELKDTITRLLPFTARGCVVR